jgi:hypothetical protein
MSRVRDWDTLTVSPVEGFEGVEVVVLELPPAKRIRTCSKNECLDAVLAVARQQSGAGQGERCGVYGCTRNASTGNKRCDPCISREKSHICDSCKTSFRCRKYLEEHKETCRSKKKLGKKFDHVCTTCGGDGFTRLIDLTRHNLSKKHTKNLEAASKI